VHNDSNSIFVGNRDNTDLWRIDGNTNIASPVPNATNGGAPFYIGVSQFQNKLLMMVAPNINNTFNVPDNLYVYDLDGFGNLSNQQIVVVGNTDDGGFVLQSQCNNRFFVTETADNQLRILNSDLSLYGIVTQASGMVDQGPYGLLENPTLKRIYVSNKLANTLKVLNECPGPVAPVHVPPSATPTSPATQTPAASKTLTPTPAPSATFTPSATNAPSKTAVPTTAPTSTPALSATPTLAPASTATLTRTPTLSATATPPPSATPTSTRTATTTATSTASATPK
jgi:hypothetical protein